MTPERRLALKRRAQRRVKTLADHARVPRVIAFLYLTFIGKIN